MLLFVPRETDPIETRVALTPDDVKKLCGKGLKIAVEKDLGRSIRVEDADYAEAGAAVEEDRGMLLGKADIVARLRKPPEDEVRMLKQGAVHISFLDPFNEKELVSAFEECGATAVSMEMIPRTTLAQKMDALSSQANIAGYVAVVLAAERLEKIMPMMTTPSGTISPSRVFVIGAGVAGLQAIATARRLGANVDAFDTRPVVEEQVKSLGAKFVKVDLGDTGQTDQGYAKELTAEQQEMQRQAMAKVCANADVVITTAQLFGRKAPTILTTDMVKGMRPGSVVVDLAIETGGNVECAEYGKEVEVDGVRVLGLPNIPGRAPVHASQMYSANITSFLLSFWNEEEKGLNLKPEDEIIDGCVVTRDGDLVNERLKEIYGRV
jgi:NAD(P) transhydrogenase subunit alpha